VANCPLLTIRRHREGFECASSSLSLPSVGAERQPAGFRDSHACVSATPTVSCGAAPQHPVQGENRARFSPSDPLSRGRAGPMGRVSGVTGAAQCLHEITSNFSQAGGPAYAAIGLGGDTSGFVARSTTGVGCPGATETGHHSPPRTPDSAFRRVAVRSDPDLKVRGKSPAFISAELPVAFTRPPLGGNR